MRRDQACAYTAAAGALRRFIDHNSAERPHPPGYADPEGSEWAKGKSGPSSADHLGLLISLADWLTDQLGLLISLAG